MKSNETLWYGVAAGCGLLFFCALCLLGALITHFVLATEESVALQGPVAAWTDPTVPNAGVSPTPPMVGPAVPIGPSAGGLGTAPRTIRATVEEVTGLADVAVGASCTTTVRRVDQPNGTFWCRAEVVCAGRTLYGGGESGYFECILYEGARPDVQGHDRATSPTDMDPSFDLDTVAGSMALADEAGASGTFSLRAHVESVE